MKNVRRKSGSGLQRRKVTLYQRTKTSQGKILMLDEAMTGHDGTKYNSGLHHLNLQAS